METRRLGNSNIQITPVGIGTAPLGSTPQWKIYWGAQDEGVAVRAIQTAIDLGVNWIDTAPFYGWGRAEQIVGQAVKGRRAAVHVFTKCGTLNDGTGGWYETLKPGCIRREIEASLRTLQTDYVDLYQFHDPDPDTPIEESWAVVQDLIQEGKVRCGGLSNHPTELVQRAMAVGPVVSLQHQYSLLERTIEKDILPYAGRHQVGVLAWGTLAHGFLVDSFALDRLEIDDFRHSHPYAQEPYRSRLWMLRDLLKQIAQDYQKTMVDLAIAWTLRQPALTGAIVGVRTEAEAAAMAGGVGWRLSPGETERIDKALKELQLSRESEETT